ncbi:exodeoxyribonuclease VII, large subunit [Parvibaculum lavamentivorans DS-1]|uniref:Exodeoxyribonuclease 7 large subunit n=1 Tax=Parvibaculum lavamentivorans (strain DS-1 / DSM 13023 / NCIMB 13966) TaxID=402881 RepID=EX7L_PARL1|nr:exodeoxyribonuclease VII large subunit [Parvibaculum lavamentivorans]A7HQR0.1 RecName: Full=Exodeoxyribonuclease 7 large subunit; AltName: Full=Exodeoxyribonuclease VII large subunit; Short=Exonuclease VII large subunit [Parvibaculum lavamentivorans DS-1]ABS62243.1 exodeoxyribonuclease VII, large subunit [Parvibaculum lavamentivorans DS-1]
MPPSDTQSPAANNAHEFSVSEISFALKKTVEETFGHVRVRGEITGYRGPHSSGHCYFGLKDDKARMDAVIWKGNFGKLRFKPEEGMEVIATGKLTTYPGSSKYQIVIDHLEPAGVGALMALLEERRKKLAAEGLFAAERKRALPFLPEVIGVVTSPTGAVIRDILHRLQDRFPRHVIVWPVRVQGETSAAEVAAAIRGFNAMEKGGKTPRPDLLIIARGGGSIEDLWSFNEEIVVRAAAESAIPLISAIGHETDTTLIDFASDRRAPTPTAAAEMAVPVRAELLADVRDKGSRLIRCEARAIESYRTQLGGLARGLPKLQDLVALPRQRFDTAADRLGRALIRAAEVKRARLSRVEGRLSDRPIRLRIANERKGLPQLLQRLTRAETRRVADLARSLDGSTKLLESYSYHGVLKRGYAVVRDETGKPIRAGAGQTAGARIEIEFAEDRLDAVVAPGGTVAPRKAPPKKPGGGQGSLL